MTLDGSVIPPLTDQPVHLGDTQVGEYLVTVWADRPARGLTRIMLADAAGRSCGDATLRGDTLTLTLPGDRSAADRAATVCLIARLVHPAGQAPPGPDIGGLAPARQGDLFADSSSHSV